MTPHLLLLLLSSTARAKKDGILFIFSPFFQFFPFSFSSIPSLFRDFDKWIRSKLEWRPQTPKSTLLPLWQSSSVWSQTATAGCSFHASQHHGRKEKGKWKKIKGKRKENVGGAAGEIGGALYFPVDSSLSSSLHGGAQKN
jgi:hypothetical protein